MKKPLVSLLLCVLLLCACLSAQAEGFTVTDMAGLEVHLDGPAKRVVALSAADCEIICAIGAQDVLVGRGEYCNYPESVLAVPAVKSGAETNLEEILALAPDVIIVPIMSQTVEQEAMLTAAGVKVIMSDAQDISGVFDAISLLGQVTGRVEEADALTEAMMNGLDALAAKVEVGEKTVYFEVSPLQYGLWAAGQNTFMDEIAQILGLKNAFADVDGWGAVSEEQVFARDPDFIVTTAMYFGEGLTPEEEIMSRPGWDALKAVRNGHVFCGDSDAITRPGPRLLDAAQAMFDFIYGK